MKHYLDTGDCTDLPLPNALARLGEVMGLTEKYQMLGLTDAVKLEYIRKVQTLPVRELTELADEIVNTYDDFVTPFAKADRPFALEMTTLRASDMLDDLSCSKILCDFDGQPMPDFAKMLARIKEDREAGYASVGLGSMPRNLGPHPAMDMSGVTAGSLFAERPGKWSTFNRTSDSAYRGPLNDPFPYY